MTDDATVKSNWFEGRMKLVIDIDGTLTLPDDSGSPDYAAAKPRKLAIKKVNELWTEGHAIVLFTARGMNSCDGDARAAEEKYRELTEEWLRTNRVNYDELVFGKPSADYYVDDKNMDLLSFMHKDIGSFK